MYSKLDNKIQYYHNIYDTTVCLKDNLFKLSRSKLNSHLNVTSNNLFVRDTRSPRYYFLKPSNHTKRKFKQTETLHEKKIENIPIKTIPLLYAAD